MGFDYICHKITHPMKRIIVLLVILFVSAISLAAQTDSVRLGYVVRGRVTDLSSGKPIESAHVSVPGRHHATVTNEDGDFSIKSDAPIRELIFSYVGYRTVRQRIGSEPVQVVMVPESILLEEALIVSGDPAQIVQAAVSLIPDNYSPKPELLECFYRETVRKRQRFTYISEAVARIYKSPYDRGSVYRDRAALEKSRILLSQRRSDTLSIKMMGGPTQAITQDVVKNSDILFDPDELNLYHFEMATPVHMDGRTQFVIRLTPKTECDYALYHGTLYIDRETLAFSRIELSLDMSDKGKATRMMLVRKPLTLRFTPRELSLIINYRWDGEKYRLEYFRSTLRFNCDWKRRLFATAYTVVNELVVTDVRPEATPIARQEMFRTTDILDEKAGEFLDPDFWADYNIIEPSESLEHAIERLKKRR